MRCIIDHYFLLCRYKENQRHVCVMGYTKETETYIIFNHDFQM